MTALVLLIVIVAILGTGVAVGLARRKRNPFTDQRFVNQWEQRMRALEASLGWRFVAEDQGFQERVPQIGRMLEADRSRVKFQLVGQWRGVPVLAVEVVLRTDNVVSHEYRTYSVVVVPRPMPGPWVLISPRDDSVWGLFEQFVTTGDPAFDSRYEVRRKNPAFATALLSSGLAQALLHDPRAVGVALAFDEHNLAVAVPGPLLQAPLGHMADLVLDVASRVPWQALPRG
ncbi:hypothetical protein [Saccharothrix coeruleofusca]|uniref:DUF3137 domain-containing protein n=1 Tax=Saccharothrix coeruleofusca TaxID=33919 RepID=A0A918EHY2_9PSEU|nr:hypothetical protein [Saccharothrix coeruleofusca]MBP2339770.1 hypothetical protein [Saccharothrix coeruleofusca]GGP80274.1 hypothetical protein GCM10010185_62630 [Saccharothrix coeruleofusca]